MVTSILHNIIDFQRSLMTNTQEKDQFSIKLLINFHMDLMLLGSTEADLPRVGGWMGGWVDGEGG